MTESTASAKDRLNPRRIGVAGFPCRFTLHSVLFDLPTLRDVM